MGHTEAGALGECAAEGVCARQRHDLHVVESLAVEHVTQVLSGS